MHKYRAAVYISLILLLSGSNYHFTYDKYQSLPIINQDTTLYKEGSEVRVVVWKPDHYEPKPGKSIGIWLRSYSLNYLDACRKTWGYKKIFIPGINIYQAAVEAGYSTDDIMMNIAFKAGTEDFKKIVSTCNARYYYIDEAVNHGCFGNKNKRLYTPDELKNVYKFIHNGRKDSYFVSSGYKRCSHFDTLAFVCDQIMYSAYSNWFVSIFPCFESNMGWGASSEPAWLNGSDDQRSSWDDMKNRYGSKFNMSWINSYEVTEFDELFNEAEKLGFSEVWIYTLDDHHFDQFGNISEAAFRHGFLDRYMRKYYQVYRCIFKAGCSSFSAGDTKCWKLETEEATDTVVKK